MNKVMTSDHDFLSVVILSPRELNINAINNEEIFFLQYNGLAGLNLTLHRSLVNLKGESLINSSFIKSSKENDFVLTELKRSNIESRNWQFYI